MHHTLLNRALRSGDNIALFGGGGTRLVKRIWDYVRKQPLDVVVAFRLYLTQQSRIVQILLLNLQHMGDCCSVAVMWCHEKTTTTV